MKTYNRKGVFLLALISFIILVFIPQLPLHAQAEVDSSLGNGSYQVELSFSSLDGIEQNRFFNEEATLNVKNGKYTLSMTINHPYILQEIHIEQTEKTLSSKWTENLVQFDVKDLKGPIMIKGLLASESEEDSFQFAQELRIILKAPIEENEQGTIIEETTPEKEWSIDYILYVDGKKEQSIMNTYVNPVAKMIEKDGKYYAQMTILKSAWVTGLTVDQRGQQVEPTLVSIVGNERIVEFEVVDLERPLRMWVQVDIPEIAYHHQYFVDLQFDEQQVANILEKPIEKEPPKQDINVKPPIVTSDKIEKPLEKKTEEPVTKSNLLSLPTVQPPFTTLVEEQLAFDRTLDANADEVVEEEPSVTEEEKQPNIEQAENKTNIDQQLAQLDKVKIVLLVLICVLSGWLLVRRLRNSKNN
ncbi:MULTISPECIES: NEAT domain-containing protein [unclassified Lysinibacillus]|uniref:NEAT domain-containing protein n=1 Tax=unclassified Lysinibacillus TaxID=2636778 RepID=UPI003803DF41